MAEDIKLVGLGAMVINLQKMRASIDAAIGNLTQALAASGAMIPTDESGSASYLPPNGGDSQSVELPRGAFLGKSLPAAIKLYLHAIKRKQTIREIATALREGGVESTSPNFEGVVTGCLNRLKANGELLRFKEGWALAEFYPENLRNRLSHEGKTRKKSSKKSASKKTTKGKAESESNAKDSGLTLRIEEYLQKKRGGEWVSAGEIVNAVNAEPKSFPLVMGRLVKKHGWEKGADGKYRAQLQ
jgi:hypothetical protein